MHILYFSSFFLPQPLWQPLMEDPAYRWIHRGELAVDGFFVLSGYLIAYFLIDEYRQRGTISIPRFYLHRWLRLTPVLWVVLGVNYWILGEKSSLWWTNVLYINNFVPFDRQYMQWTWSLAVEEQFYLLFPLTLLLLYRIRRFRLSTLLGLLAAAFAIRAWIVQHEGIRLPIAINDFVQGSGGTPWSVYADALYVKPYTRFGAILCGVIAAYLRHYTNVDEKLKRSRKTSSALLVIAFALLGLVIAAPMQDLSSTWSPAASLLYLTTHRYIAALCFACLILLSLSPAGWSKPFAAILRWRIWYPLAMTAYTNYLIQPIVVNVFFYWMGRYIRAHEAQFPQISGWMVSLWFITLASLIFLLCAVLFIFVERPFMSLRHRSLSETNQAPGAREEEGPAPVPLSVAGSSARL